MIQRLIVIFQIRLCLRVGIGTDIIVYFIKKIRTFSIGITKTFMVVKPLFVLELSDNGSSTH